jgi:hypothetical protein
MASRWMTPMCHPVIGWGSTWLWVMRAPRPRLNLPCLHGRLRERDSHAVHNVTYAPVHYELIVRYWACLGGGAGAHAWVCIRRVVCCSESLVVVCVGKRQVTVTFIKVKKSWCDYYSSWGLLVWSKSPYSILIYYIDICRGKLTSENVKS